MLDLHASLVPGTSAAGFEIGQSLSSVESLLHGASKTDYVPGFHLLAALAENKGALILRNFGEPGETSIFFGSDIVRLVFSPGGVLGCIYVFEGYLGAFEGVRVGDMLSLLSQTMELDFDGGDEMYYRLDGKGEYVPGIAIVAVEADASQHATTPVGGYCVHDWTIFRSQT
ncbi:hypothetical protein [Eleftheria terrae]|uniref:hypothetical protein n=1 Tax=Eleftheria terrae TaxID=1597781 RepID=UPI00263B6C4C|nr:hypothetical protein [Eleftheria terrae]WKB55772.1 hypothetical protein N7L95_27160 [Eleftheria terrae]